MPNGPHDIAGAAPPTIDHLIGQARVKERVKIALEAAWADGTRFQHSLMVGPPGTGKSLMASLIGREMGSTVREILAQNLSGAGELAAALLDAQDRDCVFIDEIHELNQHNQTLLYRAMEEGKLFLSGPTSSRPPRVVPLANLTILAATTDEWALATPLLQRFRLNLRFQTYSVDELAQLLKQRTHALKWQVDDAVFEKIAGRAKGTPRLGLRLLEACWRTVRSQGESAIKLDHLERTCELEELDPLGLDYLEQQVLKILANSTGPVRLNVLASKLNVPPRTVMQLERFLVSEGLIQKDDDGRELTAKGRLHLTGSPNSTAT
jgi:Holliday junction DNA helicase RuvB